MVYIWSKSIPKYLSLDESIRLLIESEPCVSITGYVQTVRRFRDGKPEYHQNIIGKTLSIEKIPKSENEVTIAGKITRKNNFNKKGTDKRLGTIITVKPGREIPNYPRVSVFREQSDIIQGIEEGSTVIINGFVQTDKTVDKETGKTLYHEDIIGIDVSGYEE